MRDFDLVIQNGMLVDPETKTMAAGSVGIRNGKIGAVTHEPISGKLVLDAAGKIVAPGFIDIHAHVEGNADCAGVMAAMGVTTVYNGNCGMSPPGNLEAFICGFERDGFLLHQLEQVGHTSLREAAGLTDRYQPATPRQLSDMSALLEKAFVAGAWGLSFGLEYVPGSSAVEVLTLAKIAAKYNRLVSIHTRTDNNSGLTGLREAIDITRLTGAAVNISHFAYQFAYGMAAEALVIVDAALAEGLDISVDSGVYTSFVTAVGSAVFDDGCMERWGCGYDSIVAGTGKYRGQRLTETQFFELRKEYPDEQVIAMLGREQEIYEILDKPYIMLSSDAGMLYDNSIPSHPQDAGTFPRFFRTMVREQNRLSLPEAVARCTIMPARRLGLVHKGRLTEGTDADLTVFDINNISDKSQFPCYGDTGARPEGIDFIIIGGELAVEHSEVKPVKPGKILRS